MESILIGLAVVFMLVGAIGFNAFRRKVYGIIGVGGSYFVLLGIISLVMLIGQLVTNFGNVQFGELIVYIVFALGGVGYLVFLMIFSCDTVGMRIFLPFAAVFIAMGFVWRFMLSLLLHIPMGSGEPEKKGVTFPATIYSSQGEMFTLENDSGDNATYYCSKTGERVHFRDCDFDDTTPTGWSVY